MASAQARGLIGHFPIPVDIERARLAVEEPSPRRGPRGAAHQRGGNAGSKPCLSAPHARPPAPSSPPPDCASATGSGPTRTTTNEGEFPQTDQGAGSAAWLELERAPQLDQLTSFSLKLLRSRDQSARCLRDERRVRGPRDPMPGPSSTRVLSAPDSPVDCRTNHWKTGGPTRRPGSATAPDGVSRTTVHWLSTGTLGANATNPPMAKKGQDRFRGLPVRRAQQELQHADGGQLGGREPRTSVARIPAREVLIAPQPVQPVPYPHCRRATRVARPGDLRGPRRDLPTRARVKRQRTPRQLNRSTRQSEMPTDHARAPGSTKITDSQTEAR